MKKIIVWLFGIVSGVIVLIIYDYISTKPVVDNISSFFSFVWNSFLSIINYNVQLWVVVLIILSYFFLRKFYYRFTASNVFNPEFINYTQGEFYHVLFKWEWKLYSDSWKVENLKPICPNDHTPLFCERGEHICLRCDYVLGIFEHPDSDKVKSLIADNVQKKLYLK